MDLRERRFIEKYQRIFEHLKEKGYKIEILFLEASEDSLLRRFSETRRNHPLSAQGSIKDGIDLEIEKLSPLRQMADKVIDTTETNTHQLKDIVQRHFLPIAGQKKMIINVTSFGYRYGLPADADLVIDVRFLPNPFYVKDLKDYNGQTYWLSFNVHSFTKDSFTPKWLNVAIGYGGEGMLYGNDAEAIENGIIQNPFRQFYLSLDVDLTKITTKYHFLKTLFSVFNTIKIPAPTLQYDEYNGLRAHFIYF